MKLIVLIILLFGVSFSMHGQLPRRCLSYEPPAVTLTGRITRKTFPGRPNYESIKKGDEPETYWILHLTQPVCLNGGESPDVPEKYVSDMQLVFMSEQPYVRYRKLFGKRVVISGTLYHAHTGHHHTSVLITVNGMKVEN